MFTIEQINEIYEKLSKIQGIKNSEFRMAETIEEDDTIVIVQNGVNKNINFAQLVKALNGKVNPSDPGTTAVITVRPDPADAVVLINGMNTRTFTAKVGDTVVIVVSKDGYGTVTKEIVISADQSIDIHLEKIEDWKGYIRVSKNPVDAEVSVIKGDDVKDYEEEIPVIEVHDGDVLEIVVSKDGYISKSYDITVYPKLFVGEVPTYDIIAVLEKEPVEEKGGTITFNVQPQGATIKVTGQMLEELSKFSWRSPEDQVISYTVSMLGYTPVTKNVRLSGGKDIIEDVTLEERTAVVDNIRVVSDGLSIDYKNVPGEGGECKLIVIADYEWTDGTVEKDKEIKAIWGDTNADWVVHTINGTYVVSENETNKSRDAEAQCTLPELDDMAISFTISQGKLGVYLNVRPESLQFESTGGTETLSVESNDDWNIN